MPVSNADKDFWRGYFKRGASHYSDGRKVYVMKTVPILDTSPTKQLARRIIFNGIDNVGDVRLKRSLHDQRFFHLWEIFEKLDRESEYFDLLNPDDYLCSDEYCNGSINYYPLYFDRDHLNEQGNKTLVPLFKEIIN